MPQLTYNQSVSGLGGSIAASLSRTSDQGASSEIPLPAGKAGTLTTRTDDNTGTATLGSGHGITTGSNVDIHWDGGVQRNVTVGAVSGTSVPFDLGIGDNLPAQSTAIVMCTRVEFNVNIDGDELVILAAKAHYANINATGGSHVDFADLAGDEIASINLEVNEPKVYDIQGGASNPFTGDVVTRAYASNGDSAYAAALQLLYLTDSTT